MDWITTSGRTLHEAKSNALDQLGIVADEAEFDVVNDVEKGLFGRVKTEARIRARVRPRQMPDKDERNSRRRNSGSKGGGNRRNNKGGGDKGGSNRQSNDAGSNDSKSNKSSQNDKSQNNQGGGKSKSQANGGQRDNSRADGSTSNGGERQKGESSQKTGSNNRNRNRGGATQAAAAASAAPKKEKKAVETEISREDQERIAQEFLEGVLGAFDMTGNVAVAEEAADDGAIEIAVSGQELGLLVGQKGLTLNAVQELTRTVVQRKADGAKTDRLRVDVAGYRARRAAALQDFATKIAHDVLDSGTEKLLEPMGPADRKVVHDTVNDIDGVETGSEGEEPRRRVVIRPS